MHNRFWTRATAVAIPALTLIVASQVLAGMDVPAPDTEVDAASGPSSTTTPTPVTSGPTTTAALPPITGPVRLDASAKIDGRGIGTVEAGMTVVEAEQSAGRRFDIVDRAAPDSRCYAATPQGLTGLRFVVRGPAPEPRDGVIVRVEATDTTWSTVSNVRVGSSVDEVKRAYGSRAKATPDGKALTVDVRDAGRAFVVLFVTSERGVVASIRSGDAVPVLQPDGCG